MPFSGERLSQLKKRIAEFQQVISSFESMNGNLRMRCANASPEIKAYCQRHIEQNSSTISSMKNSLHHAEQQLAEESR